MLEGAQFNEGFTKKLQHNRLSEKRRISSSIASQPDAKRKITCLIGMEGGTPDKEEVTEAISYLAELLIKKAACNSK